MNSSLLFCIIFSFGFYTCINICLADPDNVQDVCPTAPGRQTVFINGFPCKNPATITASDFKTSRLNHAGDLNNSFRSSVTYITAADYPGLNTLGLSIARTDLAEDGVVLPHYHPRASEMFFVSRGTLIAAFIDTKNQLFQKILKEGDIIVFPKGMLHLCFNIGNELATVFSVLNSQNPGVIQLGTVFSALNSQNRGAASLSDNIFESDSDAMKHLMRRFISLSGLKV